VSGTMPSIASDVSAFQRISAVPSILRVIAETTGLRFVTIARVTDDSWTACAVLDQINFGIEAGGHLDVATTLCSEVRDCLTPVVIDKASDDPRYRDHRTPRMYGFESYIAVPIFRGNGDYFGTLCALDPEPAKVSEPRILHMMQSFAQLLSAQLEMEMEHGEREAALLDARATAELREQFIAVLGHDLRNPLSSMNMGAEVLLRRSSDKETQAIASRIRASGHRIARMVDDLLDFAHGRLGGGIPVDIREAGDVEAALRHVVAELKSAYPDRVIRFEMRGHGSVFCDRDRVAQLLSNLLANALTHGGASGIISVTAAVNEGSFMLAVSNEGPAIPPEILPRLFLPFSRAGAHGLQGGLGLGLYIASEIARSHGGTLDVVSEDGRTTFSFHLPARRA
jgi:signal transduction histidine kinase